MKKIMLSQIMPISNIKEYKMHVAKKNSENNRPLDDYLLDFNKWAGWNEWRSEKTNRFTRKRIISFIDFYPQPGVFLFGGIFEILATHSNRYEVELLEDYKEYIGRLKVTNINLARTVTPNLENHYEEIEIFEILDKSYDSHVFPGYENINFNFSTVKTIINRNVIDWKTALENVKGVYMLTNIKNGKRYIGSAYGDSGIWSRWRVYCENGHGGNIKLKKLVEEEGLEYIDKNFMFTLLEIHPRFTQDDLIIQRENYWKEVMFTRDAKFGYNEN